MIVGGERINDLQKVMKVLEETFVSKMSEIQKDLLLVVEYSLDLEKALSIVKEENQKLKRHIALISGK